MWCLCHKETQNDGASRYSVKLVILLHPLHPLFEQAKEKLNMIPYFCHNYGNILNNIVSLSFLFLMYLLLVDVTLHIILAVPQIWTSA